MPEPASIALLGVGTFGLAGRFLRRKYQQAKPWVDRIGAAVLLVLFAPLIGVCALATKLTSRGPVFYKQKRVGQHGRLFTMLKLRTMIRGAEDQCGPAWAKGEHDPRVTPVGRVLRKVHFDELPQLVNVLRGEMSLIGPRPERPFFVDRFKEVIGDYEKRLAVKPGITGLAQIRSGYDCTIHDVRRKLRLDLLYIRRMCWWVDIVIATRTIGKLVRGSIGREQ